jgi:threonine dehydrogenase-like Zn-dependent dehydrogenase
MVLNEKLSAKALVTHRFPLEALPTAYDQFAVGDTLKVMVTR